MPCLFTHPRDMIFELLEDLDYIWRPRKRDQLCSQQHGWRRRKTCNKDGV